MYSTLPKYLFAAMLVMASFSLRGAHLVGGDLSYECLGGDQYEISLHVYKNATSGIDLEPIAFIYAIDRDNNTVLDTLYAPQVSLSLLPPNNIGCVLGAPVVSTQDGFYQGIITLPVNSNGYDIVYQRCCRTASSNNMFTSGGTSSVYILTITREGLLTCNDGPSFVNPPPILACNSSQLIYDHSAIDNDGDEITYSWCTPLDGNLTIACDYNGECAEAITGPLQVHPFDSIMFGVCCDVNFPASIGAPDPLSVHPTTGLLQGTVGGPAIYQLAICIQEWRNGVLLSSTVRDFQLTVADCQIVIAFTDPEYRSCDRTVDFNNLSAAANNYFWDFGDGTTSTETTPTHTYPGTGIYTVILQAAKDSLCFDSTTSLVQVIFENPPVADFDTAELCEGTVYQFNNTSLDPEGNIGVWDWTIGGDSYDVFEPIVTFNDTGYVDVLLVVQGDSGCIDSAAMQMFVHESLIVDVSINSFTCTNETVFFTNTSIGPIDSIFWDFGDGNSSTQFSPSHFYAAAGQYNVDMTLYNINCGNQNYQTTINIVNQPMVDLGPDQLLCNGPPVTFSVDTTGIGGATITWSTGSGQPSITIPGSTTTVTIDIDNFGCLASDTVNLTGSDSIVLDVDIQDYYCGEFALNLINNSTGLIDSVFWDFGDANTSTVFSPTHMYASTGQYLVSIDLYNSACGNKNFQKLITIVGLPVVDLGVDIFSCNGSPHTFMVDTTGVGNANILWSSGSNNPSITIPGGTYTVWVEVDNFGCITRDTLEVTGSDSIVVDIDLQDAYCGAGSIDFTNNSTGDIDSVFWDFGDGNTSNSFSPTHSYVTGGVYTVTLDLFNTACGDKQFVKNITVGNQPSIDLGPPQDICVGSPSIFTIDTTGFGPASIVWSTGDTTPSVTIIGGVPILSVTVDNGCLTTDLVVLTDRDSIVVDVTIPDGFCSTTTANFTNNSTGQIDSVHWDFGDGNTSNTFSPSHNYATGGTYTVIIDLISDACGPKSFQQTINVGSPPVVDLGPDITSCNGAPQQFTVDTTGLGGVNILWSNGVNTPSINLSGGNYVVWVEIDDAGCVARDSVDVTGADSIILDVDIQDTYCGSSGIDFMNNSTGAIDSVLWSFGDGDTSTAFNPPHSYNSGGIYTVQLDLFNSYCGDKQLIKNITVGDQPTIDLGPPQDICVGLPHIFTIDTTGFGPASIVWSTGDTTPSVTVFGGQPTLSVTINNGCLTTDLVVLNDRDSIIVDITMPNGFCSTQTANFINNSTGQIDSIHWDFGDGNTSTVFSPSHDYASGGMYIVTVDLISDACGPKSYQETIDVGNPPSVDLGPGLTTCNGVDHSITVDTVGLDGANILWSNGSNLPTITLPGGDYVVWVEIDNSGCISRDSLDVSGLDSILIDVIIQDTYCGAGNIDFINNSTGQIDSVHWDFGDGNSSTVFSPTYSFAGGGVYTITLDLFNSVCGDKQFVKTITVGDQPTIDLGPPQDICVGSPNVFSIDTTGFGPASITWSTGDTTPSVTVFGGLPTLSVTVDNGCLTTDLIVLTDRDSIIVDVSMPDNFCSTTTAVFTNNSTGHIDSVHWDFGDGNTSTDLSPTHDYATGGSYTVTVDLIGNACGPKSFQQIITVGSPPAVDLGPSQQLCAGVSQIFNIDTTGFGNADILWSTGDTTPTTSVVGGTTTLSVIVDDFGCVATDTITLTANDSIIIDVNVDDQFCSTDPIFFDNNSTGDIESVSWNFGDGITSPQFSPTYTYATGGQYTVTLTLVNTICGNKVFTQDIKLSNPPNVNIGPDLDICQGVDQTIVLDTIGFGESDILWSTSDTLPFVTFNGGINTLSVIVDNGCVVGDTIEIIYRQPIIPAVTIPANVCAGDSIQFINSSSGFMDSLHWDFGDGNTSAETDPSHLYTSSGQYDVTLMIYNSVCGNETIIENVQIRLTPVIDLGPTQEFCVGIPQLFSIDTIGFGGADITWSTGDTTPITQVIGGASEVFVTVDYFGCASTDTVILTSLDSIVVNVTILDDYCITDPVVFINNSTGDIQSTLWDFGDGTNSTDFSPTHTYLGPGNYDVSVIMSNDACGPGNYQKTIHISSPLSIDLGSPQQLCNGSSYDFGLDTTGFNGASILWSTGETTPEVTITGGVFNLSVTVDNGCIVTDAVPLTYLQPIVPAAIIPENQCLENEVLFINQSSGNIQPIMWDFGDGSSSTDMNPTHLYSSGGTYTVTLEMTNSACGDVIIQEEIRILALPEFDLGETVDICDGFGDSIVLDTTGFYGATIEWSTGETGPAVFITEGNIILYVTVDNFGCLVVDEVIISNECPIFIPTAFQPAGHNSTFNVINKHIEQYELRIYNRWGEQIYTTSNFERGWDGTYKGSESEMDVYVYVLTGVKIGGVPFIESGTVTLLR